MRLQGATPVAIKLSLQDLHIDWDEVAAAINSKTRMIIVNSPHNPTGSVFGEHDIERLTALTRNTDIVILSDEVYEHVVFDGDIHHSMARHPQLAERSVIVSSFGKTYHVTGWGGVDGRDPQGTPVYGVFRRYPDAVRLRRSLG